MRAWRTLWFGLLGLLLLPVAHADTLERHFEAAAKLLDVRAQQALTQIPDLDRQLLAMRGYLRSGKQFGDRWSWSDAEIALYNRSRERRAALAEIERIRTRFAELNPGYTLRVNTQVRSLDTQIRRWNSNASVAKIAAQLYTAAAKELHRGVYPKEPTLGSTAQFAAFLSAWFPATPAPLAVPGLSRHGQARAFDFQVLRGDKVVASTNIDYVKASWDRQGWTARLKDVIESTSDRFVGPLATPYEPWHYEYTGHTARLADADTSHEHGSTRGSVD
jgi:hypothetical protein